MLKKGFSLIELILVISVGSLAAFMKFQDMKSEQENVLASAVGQQMKQIGEAVNGYISIRYDKLSTLSNSTGNGADPGPRTCSGNTCEIKYTTLVNEGLLPSTFSGTNLQKSEYKIILKRDGITPNFVVNGLIATTLPWKEGGKMRYDLLGKAMLSAGIDSGVTKSTTVSSGYNGQWSEKSSDFRNITSDGLLTYRTGFNSALYSVYLRRDGTLPMTGNLNLGGNDINNIKNLTASGTGSFGGNVSSGGDLYAAGQLRVHNGYGHELTIGGDAAGNDFDIRIGPGGKNYLGVLSWDSTPVTLGVNGLVLVQDPAAKQHISLDGPNGNIYASNNANIDNQVNTKYVWASGNLNSNYIHSNGNIDADQRINAGEYIYINGQATLGATCSTNGLQGRTSEGNLVSCSNNIWTTSDSTPVGAIMAWASTTIPEGWLELNGQSFNKQRNIKLSQLYPSGVLPDFRGYVLRALDRGRGVDSEPQRNILSIQKDAILDHSHIAGTETAYYDNVPTSGTRNTPGGAEIRQYNNRTGGVNTSWGDVSVSTENRVKNIAVIYIIKAL